MRVEKVSIPTFILFSFFTLVFLFAILYFLPSLSKNLISTIPSSYNPQYGACKNGDTQNCTVDSCSGIMTCVNGVWGGCNWKQICEPGSKVTCIDNGCAFGFKECNMCGTGYGACSLPSKK